MVRLSRMTSREIVYRPKPSWRGWTLLPGSRYSPPEEDLDALIDEAWAVITHHSNVGIDAIVRGCPVFTLEGAADCVSHRSNHLIEDPFQPTNAQRHRFLCDLAYTQWKPVEIASGEAWDHLIQEGLL